MTAPQPLLTKHFTVKDSVYLPKWGRWATPADGFTPAIAQRLLKMFLKLEKIRELLGARPIKVINAYRPPAYNKLVGGAANSYHMKGGAIDFVVIGMDCDMVRNLLIPHLVDLGLRMEDRPGSDWVHIDDGESTPKFFKP